MGEWEIVVRLAVAGAIGAAVGLEREARNHPAGVRTHALVAVGAALFTVAGAYGFTDLDRGPNVDPARVAAQVATGIGFVGAGAIIKLGASVRGLTTAATLWLSAAVGVAAGAGAWVAALSGFVVVLLILVGLRLLKPALARRIGPPRRVLSVEYERGHGTLGPLMREIERIDRGHGRWRLEDSEDEPLGASGLRRVTIELATSDDAHLDRLVESLAARREVRSAHWEPGRMTGLNGATIAHAG